MDTVDQENTLADKYARLVIALKWPIILLLIAATVVAALQIHKLDVRNDPDTLLPPTNRYVATNLYNEYKFGMGNIMVFALRPKEGDIYKPWFINKVKALHDELIALPESRPENFIDISAQKIKYMSADENGLVFKRLIPNEGISMDNPELAEKQLAFLKEGIKTNPVMAPMLVSMYDAQGNRCAFEDYDKQECVAQAVYVIGDYTDKVKEIYLPWVREVRALMDKYGQDERMEVLVAGEPYFLAWMLADLVDKWWLFVISLGIVIVVLWVEFRDWRGALFPLIGVGMTITFTLGLMGYTEFKLTTMMVLTPMLLLAIGIGHSVQVTRRFMLEQGECGDAKQSAQIAIGHTMVPATLSIITDMVGFATLYFVDISFYKAYAIFGVFGMATLLITTTTLIPLLLTVMPPAQEKCRAGGHSWEHAVGGMLTNIVLGPAKIIPIAVIVAVMGVSVYYTKIYEGDLEDPMPGIEKGINYARAAFKGSSQTWKDLEELNRVMPGVISVTIPIRGKAPVMNDCDEEYFDEAIYDIEDAGEKAQMCASEQERLACWDSEACGPQGIMNDAEVLADMIAMEEWMRKHPYVGYTGSYAQYVSLVNMLLSAEPGEKPSKDDLYIPTDKALQERNPDDDRSGNEIVQMYNGLLEIMTSAGDMDSFVSPDWNEGVIMGFINTMTPSETHQVTMDIQQYIEDHKNDPGFSKVNFGLRSGPVDNLAGDTDATSIDGPNYVRPAVGGFLGATEATREVAIENWLKGPLQTALAIFLIAALMFRSLLVAGILVFTLFITLFAQYGLGGYFTSVGEWSGNLAFHLLVTLSIAMGLGVDYGIYMFSRLREEMQATGGNWAEALRNTQNTTGSAVIVSVIVLLGSFIPLLGTNLANTWGLGIYIGEALIIDVFTALMLLPALVYWFKPKYVFEAR
ncbi:MAG: efflux RND transporter permease subunit [bacterium]